jgi:hypothetical protein
MMCIHLAKTLKSWSDGEAQKNVLLLTANPATNPKPLPSHHYRVYNATSMQIQIASGAADGGMLCVTANHNGTTPSPPGPPPASGGFLFDVVADPTEQARCLLSGWNRPVRFGTGQFGLERTNFLPLLTLCRAI